MVHDSQDLVVELLLLDMEVVPCIDSHQEDQGNPDKEQEPEPEAAVIRLQDLVLLPVCIKPFQHGLHTPCIQGCWLSGPGHRS